MAQIKVGISNKSVPDKIQFARQIVLDMTGNGNFTTPAPALAAITAAANALEAAYNDAQAARQTAKSLTSLQNQKDAELMLLLMQEANYVQNASRGDRAKIESSGFGVRNAPSLIGPLPAPANVTVVPTEESGAVGMNWDKVRGARSYIVERATDAPQLDWVPAISTTKSKALINTITSGTKYWFRVAGVGAAGQGPWSDAVAKYAP